jgi:DNA-binding SARP family transcriptional activator/tetratricopeptide (TPR) repeat protein
MAPGFDFRVLGQLDVNYDGVAVPIGSARQRALLAALLVRPNQVVALDELVKCMWERHPTPGARTTVQNYVMRLRNALRTASGSSPISTASGGYLISVREQELDLWRLRTLVEKARSSEPELASKLLAEALSLWRGKPLADIQSEKLQRDVVPMITELLLSAAELRFDVELGLGRHNALVAELTEFTTDHPLRERFWAQLITALYRCGRQAEALDAFQRLRRTLADELGIDPGPELLDLHRRVLAGDPALAALTSRRPLPRQLPQPTNGFVGREAKLSSLDTLLARPATAIVSATGGSGKTSLVLRWAHRHVDHFPDGQLFVNLRGFDPSGPPMRPGTAVRGFLEALGVTPRSIPVEMDAQIALYRSLVADKRMLIVLDNALDSNQVTPLLPGSPSCTVLVTSRNQLGGLMIAHRTLPVVLEVLDDHEARALLANQLGPERVDAEPDAVEQLLSHCAGLPLALSIVAARAVTHKDFPLALLAEELTDASARLDAFDAGDLAANLRAVFSCSYNALRLAAAEMFGLLGLAPGPDIGLAAVASMAVMSPPRARILLRELENAHLITQYVPGRYRMHDLIRLYAAERALPGPGREAALTRLLDYYLHTAHAGELLFYPHWQPIELAEPARGCVPEQFDNVRQALSWFDAEQINLLAMHQLAVRQQWHRTVWALSWCLTTYNWRRRHSHQDVLVWRAGLAAARHLGAPTATAHRLLGRAYVRRGQLDEALDHLHRALELAAGDGDTYEQAQTHHTLAWAWENSGDDRQALLHAQHGLRLFQQLGDQFGQARAHNAVGWYHARLGEFVPAREHCEQAMKIGREQDREGHFGTLDSMGYIAHHTGQFEESLRYYDAAIAVNRILGNSNEEANVLVCIGSVHADTGRVAEARRAWTAALDRYREQHRPTQVERVHAFLGAFDADK